MSTMADVYLFNRFHSLIGTISSDQLITHSQTAELNKLVKAEFSCAYTAKREEAAYFGHKDIDDQAIFYLYRVTSCTSQDGLLLTEGVHVFFDEMSACGYMNQIETGTASSMLTALLSGTSWEVGTVDTTHTGWCEWKYISLLEAFWDFLGECDVEFKLRMTYTDGVITAGYVDIADAFGSDKGKWFEYNDKLLTITKVAENQEIATALVGLGANTTNADTGADEGPLRFDGVYWATGDGDPVSKPLGQEFVEIPGASDLYGYWDGGARFDVVRFSDCTDAVELLELTYKALSERCYPKANYKATIYPTPWKTIDLGETIAIVRDDLGIRYKTRVFKIKRNFLSVDAREFEFGEAILENQWFINWDVDKKLHEHKENHQKLKQQCDWTFADHEARLSALEP